MKNCYWHLFLQMKASAQILREEEMATKVMEAVAKFSSFSIKSYLVFTIEN